MSLEENNSRGLPNLTPVYDLEPLMDVYEAIISNIFMSMMVKNSVLVNEVCDKFSDWRRLPAELKPKVKRLSLIHI